jgi:Subtilase family
MNLPLRLITVLHVLPALYGFAYASGVVVRIKDSTNLKDLVADYSAITGYDRAGSSPFVRFEIDPDYIGSYSTVLLADRRIVWSEDEDIFSFRRNHSGHGSSVAAIYDRKLSFAGNSNIWKQINFSPQAKESQPIRVGIVDTGVSNLQSTIIDNVVAGASFVEGSQTIDDFPANIDSNFNGVPDEGVGHGTMVAGVILQLAPNTPLVIAKSADSDGSGTSWSVLKGMVFCLENGVKVINVSLGSHKPLPGFAHFLEWVEEAKVVVVSPIGNNSSEMALFPAANPTVIGVAGLLPDNTKAPFSNWSTLTRVSAPASGISSSWYDGRTATWSGTSLAAPLVTGCLALALVDQRSKHPKEIRNALRLSGRDIDELNPAFKGRLGKLIDFLSLVNLLKK